MFDAEKGPGRVFFHPEDTLQPEWVAYQPLANHVENVRYLLKNWRTDTDIFDLAVAEAQRQELFEGAAYHDWGKTAKFSIRKTKTNNKEHWTYSYAGHRFLHPPHIDERATSDTDVLYHRTLENAHHDYSVAEVVKDSYELKQQKASYKNYPQDLFVLEMCDQIEAEVAVMAIQGKAGRNSSFMEFEVSFDKEASSDEKKVFTLEPFPFEGAVTYTLYFRKDQTVGKKLEAHLLKEQGFTDYEPLEQIDVTLQGHEEQKNHPDDIGLFYKTASGFTPNALQNEVWHLWQKAVEQKQAAGLIVKAPTGVGKTEACVYPRLANGQRVLLVLPAKALVDDHKQRFESVLQKLSSEDKKQRRLLVDTGDAVELYTFSEGRSEEKPDISKRHLYRADIILTTLDKFLYRFFGYGGGKKSYTYPLRINDKSRMAFVFDEAHSYEGTAFTNFQRLVTTLYDNGHNIVLMTATLPENYQTVLQDPDDFGFAGRWDVVDYLEESNQDLLLKGEKQFYGKRRLSFLPDSSIPEAADPDDPESFEVAREAFNNHKQERIETIIGQIKDHWTGSERLIITLDRVQDAADVYKRLRASTPNLSSFSAEKAVDANLFLYHGRLDRKWRSKAYAALKQRDDNRQPYVLVSTSAIEIGVDLDSQTLITEVCNPDSLVQRIGRCNRKGVEGNAKVIVVGSHIPNYLDAFGENRDAYEAYLSLLAEHHQKTVDRDFAKAAMAVFPKPVLTDPRAATAYDMLYRYVYEFELEYKNLHDLGFIATRSWEPALEVLIPVGGDAFDRVQVPVGRMSRNTDDAEYVRIEEYRMHRDRDKSWSGKWEEVTRGGDLYKGTYRTKLLEHSTISQNYQQDLGLVDIPQIFQRQRWRSDPPLMVRLNSWAFEKTKDEDDVLFFANESNSTGKKSSRRLVFSYLADPTLDIV